MKQYLVPTELTVYQLDQHKIGGAKENEKITIYIKLSDTESRGPFELEIINGTYGGAKLYFYNVFIYSNGELVGRGILKHEFIAVNVGKSWLMSELEF